MYPNLEWRTAGDSDVRPEHDKLDGLILPINDPFWRGHNPPLGFGCRCELTQTDKPAKQNEGYNETPAPKGFDFNPGIDQKLFSDNAGYYTRPINTEAKMLNRWAGTVSGSITRNAVRKALKGSNKKLLINDGALKSQKITLSNTDIVNITGKNIDNQALRNIALYDIETIAKDASFIKSVPDPKVDPKHIKKGYEKWHYYKVNRLEKMYLNFVETNFGVTKLHAITDSLKKK